MYVCCQSFCHVLYVYACACVSVFSLPEDGGMIDNSSYSISLIHLVSMGNKGLLRFSCSACAVIINGELVP